MYSSSSTTSVFAGRLVASAGRAPAKRGSSVVKAARFDNEALLIQSDDDLSLPPKLESERRLCTTAEARLVLVAARQRADEILVEVTGLREQAERMLHEARVDAGRMIGLAQAEATDAWDNARRVGYEEGRRNGEAEGQVAGQAAGRAALFSAAEQVRSLAEGALVDHSETLRVAEREVVELAIAVASKVIGQEVAMDPSVVARIVGLALEETAKRGTVRVRLNPVDHVLLVDSWRPPTSESDETRYELLADESVEPGGCVVQTRSGTVDASPSTQLASIRDAFLE